MEKNGVTPNFAILCTMLLLRVKGDNLHGCLPIYKRILPSLPLSLLQNSIPYQNYLTPPPPPLLVTVVTEMNWGSTQPTNLPRRNFSLNML